MTERGQLFGLAGHDRACDIVQKDGGPPICHDNTYADDSGFYAMADDNNMLETKIVELVQA
eukprot:7026092-Pyramimonas_sp.AAC.1